jgi:CO/xanthine dehydrogenase Mo-binding subunit
VLRIPVARVKVIPLEIGGGFGGKIPIYLDPVAALLSKKSGRPVKLSMNRTDVFEGTGPTSGTVISIKAGAKDGRLHAVQATMRYEAGAPTTWWSTSRRRRHTVRPVRPRRRSPWRAWSMSLRAR